MSHALNPSYGVTPVFFWVMNVIMIICMLHSERKKEFVNFTNAAAVQLLELLENQVRLRSNGSEVSGLSSRSTRSIDDGKLRA